MWITCPVMLLRGSCNPAHSKGRGHPMQTKAVEKWMPPGKCKNGS